MTDLAEAPYTATIKASGDFDAPWLVVRAYSEQELESRLQAVEAGGSLATIGRVGATFAAAVNLGKGLGARGLDAPVNVTAQAPTQPTAEQNAVDPNWGQPQAAQVPAYAQQSYAPPAPPAPAMGRPGVPMIVGQEAKFIDKGRWKAWADPRPQSATQHIPDTNKTDDPNHPGLAAGTHKFWQFVR